MHVVAAHGRRAVGRMALVGVLVLVLVVAVGGYVATKYMSQSTPPSGPSVITIGMSMPLTGTFAEDGQMSLDGLQLWAQNVNASGGIYVSSLHRSLPVKLIVYDDQSNPTRVATLYQQLVTQDNVNFLIAPYASPLTLAAAPIADAHHILLLSHGGASDAIWQKNYSYVVGVLSPASQYMIPVINMLVNLNSSQPLNVAMFYGNDPFSIFVMNAAARYMQTQFPGKFNIVFNQSYQETATDYTAQLTQIAATNADVILGGGHFTDGETIMKNIQAIGYNPKAVALLVAPDDVHFYQDLGTVANFVLAPSQWEANLNYAGFSPYFGNITSQQFATQFTGRFNMQPNYEAAEAYATGLVLEKAIIDSGSLNSTVVRQQLNSENFYTFYGHFQIAPSGIQIGHTMVVVQWQNGAKQTIWPTSVATAQFEYPAAPWAGRT